MEDQLILPETAKLAKEKGFDCRVLLDKLLNIGSNICTQSLLAKWLREVHKIDIMVTFSEFSRTYGYKIYFIENGKTEWINHRYDKNEIFELALEAGLQEGLKLIK